MRDCLIKPITRGSLSTLLSGGPAPLVQTWRSRPQTVNPALIADLAARLDPARLADLLGRFVQEGDSTIARLSAGVPDAEARMLIHRLAGSAATFGAVGLGAQLQQAEAALGADPPEPDAAHGLAAQWAQTRAALAAALSPQDRAAE